MEKTEKPTPHKLNKAKEEGQTYSSRSFESFIKLFFLFFIFCFGLKLFFKLFKEYISDSVILMSNSLLFKNTYNISLSGIFFISTILFVSTAIGILLPVIYRPNLISANIFRKKISDYFKNMNIINLFSREKLVRVGIGFIKILVFLLVASIYVRSQLFTLKIYSVLSSFSLIIVLNVLYKILLFSILLGLLIGTLDLFFEKYRFIKSLYMTKQEVKEEFKNQEGDPEIKAKLKRLRNIILFSDMKRDVKRAKFLLVNPTHIAISVIYSGDEDAPTIGYIGIDNDAQKMISLAKANCIPIIKNIGLAREFYKIYEPGDQIDEKHYEIVASIISFLNLLNSRIDYIDMDNGLSQ